MRVVADTNVLVSGLIHHAGPPGRIIAAWRDGRFDLCQPEPLLEELREAISRPELRRFLAMNEDQVARFLDRLRLTSLFIPGTPEVHPLVPDDPDDDIVAATAIASNADVIISGDRHLLKLGSVQGIPIISPTEFAQRWLENT